MLNIDLRCIADESYQTGDRIIGSLDDLGWEVLRSGRITNGIDSDIKEIGRSGGGWCGQWHAFDDNVHRVKKYSESSDVSKEWRNNRSARDFLDIINNKVLNKRLDGGQVVSNYVIQKFNLMRNIGKIYNDDKPHTDYLRR